MKENRKMELTSYDEIFSTEESRQDAAREKVMEIPLSELYAFRDHPFKVQDDERMLDTAQSIRVTICRLKDNGRFQSFHKIALPWNAEFCRKITAHSCDGSNGDLLHLRHQPF